MMMMLGMNKGIAAMMVESAQPVKTPAVEVMRNKLVPIRRTGWQNKTFVSLGKENEEEYLRSVIKQVVVGNAEGVKVSTSIMVYGPPGCGKSQLVDIVVKHMETQYSTPENPTFDVIRLEGVYCSNLQDTILEICNQIIEDGDMVEILGVSDTTPFDEKLEAILFYLKNKLLDAKKALVIIIDEIERFTSESLQKLLYNLFDISANAAFSVPVCIIGITCCVDILDFMEKRVRSRFSHRQINLIPQPEFTEYQSWAKQLLSHSKLEKWNIQVQAALGDNDVVKTLRSLYDTDRSIGQLKKLLYAATLICEGDFSSTNVQDAYKQLFGTMGNVQMAIDLPQSELVVLLGIYKKIQRSLQAWKPSEIFEIVRKPYAQYQLSKDDFIQTIIKFQDLELIIPVGGSQQSRRTTNVLESYYKSEISYTEFKEIWKNYPNLPATFNEFL